MPSVHELCFRHRMPFMGQPDYRIYEMNRRLQQWTEVNVKLRFLPMLICHAMPQLGRYGLCRHCQATRSGSPFSRTAKFKKTGCHTAISGRLHIHIICYNINLYGVVYK